MSRAVICVLLLIISTSAAAKHVYPKSLEAVENGATYTLTENYVFKEKAATFTLFSGNYVQRYEDAKAIYLIGDGSCIEMSVIPPKNPAAAWADKWGCGIFLPKDPNKGAAFFMIRRAPEKIVHLDPEKASPSGQGLIVDAIISAGYGSFDFPTSKNNDMLLRVKLHAVQP